MLITLIILVYNYYNYDVKCLYCFISSLDANKFTKFIQNINLQQDSCHITCLQNIPIFGAAYTPMIISYDSIQFLKAVQLSFPSKFTTVKTVFDHRHTFVGHQCLSKCKKMCRFQQIQRIN